MGIILSLVVGASLSNLWHMAERGVVTGNFLSLLIGIVMLSAIAGIVFFLALRLLQIKVVDVIIEKVRMKGKGTAGG